MNEIGRKSVKVGRARGEMGMKALTKRVPSQSGELEIRRGFDSVSIIPNAGATRALRYESELV